MIVRWAIERNLRGKQMDQIKLIKEDLNYVYKNMNGVTYYRSVPVTEFNREQLIAILSIMFNKNGGEND